MWDLYSFWTISLVITKRLRFITLHRVIITLHPGTTVLVTTRPGMETITVTAKITEATLDTNSGTDTEILGNSNIAMAINADKETGVTAETANGITAVMVKGADTGK